MSILVGYGDQGKLLTKKLLTAMQWHNQLDPKFSYGIKPNLVVAKPSSSGATTDPQILAGIIEYLQEHSCYNITVMESAWIGASTEQAFATCGYKDLARTYGVKLVDLKQDLTVKRSVDGLDLELCAQPLQMDYLINVPVLKAHCQTRLTCALKNLKGCIPDREKRRFHRLGLHRPIAALNKALPVKLVVVDGIIGDLTFEEGGTPVKMHRVLMGSDPVAIDSYCANLLGYSPSDIEYIPLAKRLGVGEYFQEISELNTGEETIPGDKQGSFSKTALQEDQACSACVGSALHALQRYKQNTNKQPTHKLYIGQGYRNKSCEGLGIGNCTKGFSTFVPGCPPSAKDILEKLQQS